MFFEKRSTFASTAVPLPRSTPAPSENDGAVALAVASAASVEAELREQMRGVDDPYAWGDEMDNRVCVCGSAA